VVKFLFLCCLHEGYFPKFRSVVIKLIFRSSIVLLDYTREEYVLVQNFHKVKAVVLPALPSQSNTNDSRIVQASSQASKAFWTPDLPPIPQT